jgi:hypothetical protein
VLRRGGSHRTDGCDQIEWKRLLAQALAVTARRLTMQPVRPNGGLDCHRYRWNIRCAPGDVPLNQLERTGGALCAGYMCIGVERKFIAVVIERV